MAVKLAVIGDSNSEPTGSNGAGGASNVWAYKARAALAAVYPSQTFTLDNQAHSGGAHWDYLPDSPTHPEYLAAVLAADPHIVMAMLGTNGYGDTTYYSANMASIVAAIHAHTNADGTRPSVVLMQPPVAAPLTNGNTNGTADGFTGTPPTDSAHPNAYFAYGRPRTSYGAVQGLTERKDAITALAADAHVATWDNFSALGWSGTTNTSSTFMYDGVHLNATGQNYLAGWAKTAVQTLLAADGSLLAIVYDLAESIEALYGAPAATNAGTATDTGTPLAAGAAPAGTDTGDAGDTGTPGVGYPTSAVIYDLAAAIDAIYDVPGLIDAGFAGDTGAPDAGGIAPDGADTGAGHDTGAPTAQDASNSVPSGTDAGAGDDTGQLGTISRRASHLRLGTNHDAHLCTASPGDSHPTMTSDDAAHVRFGGE